MSHRVARDSRWTRLLLVLAVIAIFAGQSRSQQLPVTSPALRTAAVTAAEKATAARNRAQAALRRRQVSRPANSGSGTAAGTIFTVAGELFQPGYVQDGGPATQTSLAFPSGVSLDASGTLYIADTANNIIRTVPTATTSNPSPIITTIAGFPPADNTFNDQIVDSCGAQLLNMNLPASQGCLLNGYPAAGTTYGTFSFMTVPSDVKVDADGNIYILDAGDQVVTVVYSGQGTQLKAVLARLAAANPGVGYENPQPGYMYTLAGTLDTTTVNYNNGVTPPTPALAGEAGPATRGGGLTQSATFGGSTYAQTGGSSAAGPTALFVDAGGNIYIADNNNNLVRVVYEGASVPPVLTALNITPVAGNIYTIAGTYSVNDPNNGGDGLNDCSTLQTGSLCGDGGLATSAFLNFPAGVAVDAQGNVYISDQFDNVIRVVYVGGSVAGASASDVAGYVPGNIYTIAGDKAGLGTFTNSCVPSNTNCGDAGPASASTLYSPANLTFDLTGNLYISDNADQVVRAIYAEGELPNISSPKVGYIYTIAGHINGAGNDGIDFPSLNACVFDPSTNCGDGGAANDAFLYNPAGLAFDSLNNLYIADTGSPSAATGDTVVREVVGIAPGKPQTITFPAAGSPALPTSVVYGATPIELTATASSGLTVSFSVGGAGHLSGSTVVIDKAGTITITASQGGNSTYSPAPPVTKTIQVTEATLTVAGQSVSVSHGSPVPSFANDYTITGFQYNDTQASATTGSPVVTASPAYTTTTPIGTAIALVVTQGTLAATPANYKFKFVNGSVSVTGTAVQTLTFPSIANQTYGAKPITLAATSSSGLAVSYAVTAGASAARVSGSVLSIIGAAQVVTVTASQPGNDIYAAATPVSRTFLVAPAPLKVSANDLTVITGAAIPALTYTITGFVNGDSQATATTGLPTLSTTAKANDPIGTYPITITAGSFSAPNYAPTFIDGTLTIAPPTPQTITFAAPPTPVIYGGANIALKATASSGLPVTFTAVGPGTITGSSLHVTGVGVITVTATQDGNAVYGAATPVSHSITADPATITVTADSYTLPITTPVPSLGYTLTGFVNGDTQASAVTGAPVLTTTDEGTTSPQGVYPITITQGTLAATKYVFTFVNGTITVLPGPPPDYSVTVTPTAITMAPGQVQQATLFVVPLNGYVNTYNSKTGAGGISFTCGSLPANVSCNFSPAAVSVNGQSHLVGPLPSGGQLTTLTISTGPALAQDNRPLGGGSAILPAALFLLPGGLAGLMLAVDRRRFGRSSRVWRGVLLICLLGGLAGMGACGYSNTQNTSSFAKPGTATISIDALGAPSTSSPTGDTNAISHNITLTVTIQ